MKKLNKNEMGFGVIEAILVLVIVAAIAGVGWYVWNARSNANSNYNSATSASAVNSKTITTIAASSYAGWNTYQDSVAGYSIKYPSNWTVNVATDNLMGAGSDGVLIYPKGQDNAMPNGEFQLEIDSFDNTNAYGKQFPDKSTQECYKSNDKVGDLEKINVPKYGTLYVVDHQDTQLQPNIYGTAVCTKGSGDVGSFIASPTQKGSYSFITGSGSAGSGTTYAQFSTTTDVKTAKQILSSLSY